LTEKQEKKAKQTEQREAGEEEAGEKRNMSTGV